MEEIEVTEEMKKEGAYTLIGYDRNNDSAQEMAEEVYRAMESVKRGILRDGGGDPQASRLSKARS